MRKNCQQEAGSTEREIGKFADCEVRPHKVSNKKRLSFAAAFRIIDMQESAQTAKSRHEKGEALK